MSQFEVKIIGRGDGKEGHTKKEIILIPRDDETTAIVDSFKDRTVKIRIITVEDQLALSFTVPISQK